MMRARKWGRKQAAIAVAIGVAAAAVWTFPMRLALDMGDAAEAGLSARAVSGNIWSGQLVDAKWGRIALGNVQLGLAPIALLRGEAALHFQQMDSYAAAASPAVAGAGAAGAAILSGTLYAGSMLGVSGVNGRVDMGMALGALRVDQLMMQGVTMRFDRTGQCAAAEGQVQAALSSPVAGLAMAQGLSGTLRCVKDKAQMQLTSQSGMEVLEADISGQGIWDARFVVKQASDPALVHGLTSMGFRSVGDAYVLAASGKI